MKAMIRAAAALLFCVCGSGGAAAQSPADDALQSLLFSPEILLRHRDQIGLTDRQAEQIRERVEQAGSAAREREERLKSAMSRLVQALSADRVDEQGALEQLNQVLDAERELKQLHMRLLIQIRNELTADQRRVAGGIWPEPMPTREVEQRLQSKITRIEKEVQARAQAGEPPLEAIGFMQKLPELMQKGQVRDAEALLDQVLSMLGLAARPAGALQQPAGPASPLGAKMQQVQRLARQKQQGGEDVSAIAELMQRVAALASEGQHKEAEAVLDQALRQLGVEAAKGGNRSKEKPESPPAERGTKTPRSESRKRSESELVTQVAGLRQEKVAWREIAWKSCLLEGLQASREQNKPIMLWIFIDRPLDDERC